MKLRNVGVVRRISTVTGIMMTLVLMFAAPALAHKAVILDSKDTLPWKAPLLVDGTDNISFYGRLPHAGAVRSAQLNLQEGDEVTFHYGIPDQAPENELATRELPRVFIVAPDGEVTVLEPKTRDPRGADPHSILRLRTYLLESSVTGTYSILVTGAAPARFLVSLGLHDGNHDFHGIERGSLATLAELEKWFATPPTG